MSYQRFQTYDGSLYGATKYDGLEYDWEVPNESIVESPGGVSTVHHHWTKGFYGRGNTSSDIYAGQGNRYIAGEYGNLYQSGQTASQEQGYYVDAPDYQYWQNETPQQNSLGGKIIPPFKNTIENYESSISSDDFELIESDQKKSPPTKKLIDLPTTDEIHSVEKKVENKIKISKISPLVLFVFLILLFMTFHFWARASDSIISQVLHNGKTPSWQRRVLYAIVATVFFIIIVWLLGIPLVTFE